MTISNFAIQRRRRRRRKETFSRFIRKVLKQVHPDAGISRSGMSIMNSLVMDVANRLMDQSSALTRSRSQSYRRLKLRDVEYASKLVLPLELAKVAISEQTKAIKKSNSGLRQREKT